MKNEITKWMMRGGRGQVTEVHEEHEKKVDEGLGLKMDMKRNWVNTEVRKWVRRNWMNGGGGQRMEVDDEQEKKVDERLGEKVDMRRNWTRKMMREWVS